MRIRRRIAEKKYKGGPCSNRDFGHLEDGNVFVNLEAFSTELKTLLRPDSRIGIDRVLDRE